MAGEAPLIGFALALIFGLAFAISDLKTMTIPNKLTIACFIAVAIGAAFTLPAEDVLWRLAGAAVVMAVGMSLYFLKAGVGGGDVKAAAALTALVASGDTGVALILLSLNGLIVTLVIYLARRVRANNGQAGNGDWAVWSAQGRVPYGLVLGLAAIQYTGLLALLTR
jgi:prepilin peptidase CpaA